MFSTLSSQNLNFYSLSGWQFFSKHSITLTIYVFPASIPFILPQMVVPFANNDSVLLADPLLALCLSLGGNEFPGIYLYGILHFGSILFLSSLAILIALEHNILNRTGDVAHPSLNPPLGIHSELFLLFPSLGIQYLHGFSLKLSLSSLLYPTYQVHAKT